MTVLNAFSVPDTGASIFYTSSSVTLTRAARRDSVLLIPLLGLKSTKKLKHYPGLPVR